MALFENPHICYARIIRRTTIKLKILYHLAHEYMSTLPLHSYPNNGPCARDSVGKAYFFSVQK